MKWLAASLVVLACSAGCHAPKPSFNLMAPYGSTRVPPPATNSTARSAPYYPQPGSAPAGSAPAPNTNPTGGQGTAPTPSLSNPSLTSSADVWQSVATRSAAAREKTGASENDGVALAAFQSPSSSGQTATNPPDAQLRWNGEPQASATGSSEPVPGLFVPDAGSSPIASLPPPPTAAAGRTVVATAKASDAPQRSSSPEGKPTLQWKSP
jgi:hypothetical protein